LITEGFAVCTVRDSRCGWALPVSRLDAYCHVS